MQIMTEKGTLIRDEIVRPQLYRPAQPQHQPSKASCRTHHRAFGGSSSSLVMQALAERRSTAEERRQIRELLDRLDAREK